MQGIFMILLKVLAVIVDNNKYILVEKIAFTDEDSNIKEEISITVADKNNLSLQDIVRVRKSESKENNVELLVWDDCNNQDYTNKFSIECNESEKK